MLPQLRVPQYKLTLPSTGKELTYRPFTVKEEKILLMALDEDDSSQIRALRQVIENCLFGAVNATKLPTFDIDYIWLKIRSKSIEEIVTIPFECRNKLPEGEKHKDPDGQEIDYCGNIVNVPVNLDLIETVKNPSNNPKIELQDGIGIVLKYPTFELFQKLGQLNEKDIDNSLEIILDCVEMIYDSTGAVYERENISRDELITFLESLSQVQFAKVLEFFETLPAVRHKVHFKCPKCKHEVDVVVEGTKSFLASDSATNHLGI
jgi:hypothetical protein